MLTVRAPDGQQLQIQVPAGVPPGSMISVPYTPQMAAQPLQVMVQPVQMIQPSSDVMLNQVAPVPVMTRNDA